MLKINVPFVHLVHDLMLAQYGGRAGLRQRVPARVIVEIVAAAPSPKTRGATPPGKRATAEYAAHYLSRMLLAAPFRDQNTTTAWVLALYAIRERGYTFGSDRGPVPYRVLCEMERAPEKWPEVAIGHWFEQRIELAGARHKAA